MSTSPSPAREPANGAAPPLGHGDEGWPSLPIETDIYILPDGRVVVADLPAELAAALPRLGAVEPCEITDHDFSDSAA